MNNLYFLIPPAIGAFIGYSTNVLAIKMLFRPLKEIRILKIRLPFTPGILPRQRSRLAESIGNMVERELITPEILRGRLMRDDVQEKIKETLSSFTGNILEKSPNELFEGQEKLLSAKVTEAAEKLYPALAFALINFLNRDDIRKELESRGRIFLKSIFLKLNVFQRFFLSAAQYDLTLEEKMPEIIKELTENAEKLLQNDGVKNKLLNTAASSFEKIIGRENIKLITLFNMNEDGKKKLDNFLFNKLISAVDGQIENILSSIDIEALVSDRINSLDMLRVERIILDVMSDQFKWIEILGGVLGFLIGLFQLFFNWFLR